MEKMDPRIAERIAELRNVNPAKLEAKARARVTWGDTREQVEALLRRGGLDAHDTAKLLDKLYAERAASFRAKGVRDMILGAVLIVVCGGPIASGAAVHLGAVGLGGYGLIGLLGCGAVAGVWIEVRGLDRFFRPERQIGHDEA